MELMNLSCKAFLEDLAGSAPAPGGGGAAALVGAAGAALGNMVGSLTIGKKKYAAVEADILVLNRRAAALRKRLEGWYRPTPTPLHRWPQPTSCPKRPRSSRPTKPQFLNPRWKGPVLRRWRSCPPAVRALRWRRNTPKRAV